MRGRPAGSIRLIGIAATASAALHLTILAAVSDLFSLPDASEPANSSLKAVLLSLPALPADAPVTAIPAPVAEPRPQRPARTVRRVPVVVADAETVDAPQLIRRESPSRASQPARVASAPPPAEPELPERAEEPPSAPVPPAKPGPPEHAPPKRILLEYNLRSSLVDGSARYVWLADTEKRRYTITGSMEADGFFASMFAGRFDQESSGELLPSGLRPMRFSLRRGEAPPEVANFDWAAKVIQHQRTRSEHVQPLSDHAQDLQSFIFQFSYEFRGPNPPGNVAFAITNARKMDTYEFRVVGRERLKLPLGDIDTIHLVRVATDPGDAYEAWIAPDFQHLPVKIRFMLSGRFPVDQIATRIDIEP